MALLALHPRAASAQSEFPQTSVPLAEESILLQEIPSVYGASKYEQKVTQAPSSVTIITSDDIKKYGYRTLADLLQSVNGFSVSSDRNYSYVGVRGFGRPADYNTRVLLLLDGHRLNDNIYDSATLGTESPIDVDLIRHYAPIAALDGAEKRHADCRKLRHPHNAQRPRSDEKRPADGLASKWSDGSHSEW